MTQTTLQQERTRIEQAVARFFHMSNSHCPGNLAPLMTPDVELWADDQAKGQEAVNAYFVRLWEAYPQLTFSVENTLIDGSAAAVEVSYEQGPGGRGERCIVMHFRGELVRRIRCY